MSFKITDVTVTKMGGQDCSLAGVLREGEENNVHWWRLSIKQNWENGVIVTRQFDVELNGGERFGRVIGESLINHGSSVCMECVGDGKLHEKEKTVTRLEQAAAADGSLPTRNGPLPYPAFDTCHECGKKYVEAPVIPSALELAAAELRAALAVERNLDERSESLSEKRRLLDDEREALEKRIIDAREAVRKAAEEL